MYDLLQEEVKKEPYHALVADDNGLIFYKKILSNFENLCKSNGIIFFEIGAYQAGSICDYAVGFSGDGYDQYQYGDCRYLCGRDRQDYLCRREGGDGIPHYLADPDAAGPDGGDSGRSAVLIRIPPSDLLS